MNRLIWIYVGVALLVLAFTAGARYQQERHECPAPAAVEAAPCMEAECTIILRFSQQPMDECLRQLEACQRRTL